MPRPKIILRLAHVVARGATAPHKAAYQNLSTCYGHILRRPPLSRFLAEWKAIIREDFLGRMRRERGFA